MKIEKVDIIPDDIKGRPSRYPFRDLTPGHKLIIPIEPDNLFAQRNKIGSAIYQFKKQNRLDWKTAVRVEGDNICVYRIA